MRKLDEHKKRQARAAFQQLLEHLAKFHREPGNKGPRRLGAEVLSRLARTPFDTVQGWYLRPGYVPLGKASLCARVGRHMGLEITKEQLAPDLED